MAFSHKNTLFLLTGSQDRTVKYWELAINSNMREGGLIASSLATTSATTMIMQRARYTIKAHDKDINSLDVSLNDKWFVTASQGQDSADFSCG